MNSLKDKAVLAVLGVVALYAIAVALWFTMQEPAWKKAAKAYKTACNEYRREKDLILEMPVWTNRYEQVKQAMPLFSANKKADNEWGQRIERIAKKNHITTKNRVSLEENRAGEVYELPIEIKNLEGSFDSLVGFLWELENSEEGMFDIRVLYLKPYAGKRGYVRGNCTVTCAYMRE